MKDEILELYWIGDVNYATAITGGESKKERQV